jgi:hypothetical protein
MKLSDQERLQLLTCSIERVVNNALWLADKGMTSRNAVISERAWTLQDDLEALKPLLCRLWANAQEDAHSG